MHYTNLSTLSVEFFSKASANLCAVLSVSPTFVKLKDSRCVFISSPSNSWINFSSDIFWKIIMLHIITLCNHKYRTFCECTISNKFHIPTLMLFQFKSISEVSSSRTCLIVASTSVSLGGSIG